MALSGYVCIVGARSPLSIIDIHYACVKIVVLWLIPVDIKIYHLAVIVDAAVVIEWTERESLGANSGGDCALLHPGRIAHYTHLGYGIVSSAIQKIRSTVRSTIGISSGLLPGFLRGGRHGFCCIGLDIW